MATKPLIVNAQCHYEGITVVVQSTTSNYATTKRPDVVRMYDVDGHAHYGTLESACSFGMDIARDMARMVSAR
jgi:hypothetical protein